MNILLALTGSIAVLRANEIYNELSKFGTVKVIVTNAAKNMAGHNFKFKYYTDKDEAVWEPGKILHISLREWAHCLVIAPCTMNTLAKIAGGVCDNLVTETVRAWDNTKHMFIVPAANTLMWENKITQKNIAAIKDCYKSHIINPISGQLVCGDIGLGKIANTYTICEYIKSHMRLFVPLYEIPGIPVGNHPGAFGYKRSYYYHPGVDLYSFPNAPVFACEDGIVIKRGQFTGPPDHPHWLKTQAVVIKGAHIINYGEIESYLTPGTLIKKGMQVGKVTPVLPPEKFRPDIAGHSCSMLHFEMYSEFKDTGSTADFADWKDSRPNNLIDPTDFLIGAYKNPVLLKG